MKIVNIDANMEKLSKSDLYDLFRFIYDVVRPLEKELFKLMHIRAYFPQWDFRRFGLPEGSFQKAPVRTFVYEGLYEGYANVANLLHTIPIFLRDKKRDGEGIIDPLGAYYPNTKDDNPYIELFIEPILDSVKGNKQKFKWLFTKVLMHELAHAALDLNNIEDCRFYKCTHSEISYYTDFGKWREESMANAIALRIIKEYGDPYFYKYAKSFMQKQFPEYALGVFMEDFDDNDFLSLIWNKGRGVNTDLQEIWLDYVQNGKPTRAGLKRWNEILKSEYVYFFNGKYYADNDLVEDILIDVLNGYEVKHGKKMKIEEFENVFPNIKVHGWMAYEPSTKVKKWDDYYKYFSKISNVNYSLYCCSWDNASIHKFVSKSGCNFKEYKNWK